MIDDSRLKQCEALIDDSRCLLADIEEESPDSANDAQALKAAHNALNVALWILQSITEVPHAC